jgi:hypothetical protein
MVFPQPPCFLVCTQDSSPSKQHLRHNLFWHRYARIGCVQLWHGDLLPPQPAIVSAVIAALVWCRNRASSRTRRNRPCCMHNLIGFATLKRTSDCINQQAAVFLARHSSHGVRRQVSLPTSNHGLFSFRVRHKSEVKLYWARSGESYKHVFEALVENNARWWTHGTCLIEKAHTW